MLPAIKGFGVRAVGPADQKLLWEIFRDSRSGALAGLPDPLLRMQHRAREAAFAGSHPDADSRLLMVEGQPAGRLLVGRSSLELRLIDIAILPDYRDRGLGTLVLRSLIEEAAGESIPLRLTVATDNSAAFRLYRRLGFEICGEDVTDIAMEVAAC